MYGYIIIYNITGKEGITKRKFSSTGRQQFHQCQKHSCMLTGLFTGRPGGSMS